jgi:hypothetical protein
VNPKISLRLGKKKLQEFLLVLGLSNTRLGLDIQQLSKICLSGSIGY